MLLSTGVASAQSLSEIAKKEKERRKKLKEKGEQVQVITEDELNQVRREPTTPSESSPESSSAGTTPPPRAGSRSAPPSRTTADEAGGARSAPTEIPSNAPLRDKIAIFEQMLAAYRQEVQEIDAEIAKNNTRIEEIQQRLNTIGAGGLPVAPTAPQADQSPRYPGEDLGLQAEQQELRRKNQELETTKARKASELRTKGRRAGIPAGYLRF
jgi:hypothetical protein